MSDLRVLCRVVTYNPATKSILLVRNKGQDWWYAPGGEWEHTTETLPECARREVLEETGRRVRIGKTIYTQTLYIDEQDSTWLEIFWLAEPLDVDAASGHTDMHGTVEESRWFDQTTLREVTAYPKALQAEFWENIDRALASPEQYLGHFQL